MEFDFRKIKTRKSKEDFMECKQNIISPRAAFLPLHMTVFLWYVIYMNTLYKVEEYSVADFDELESTLLHNCAISNLKNENGETVFFKSGNNKSTAIGMLGEIVLPNICAELEQPCAKTNPAILRVDEERGIGNGYRGTASVNFLKPEDELIEFNEKFDLGHISPKMGIRTDDGFRFSMRYHSKLYMTDSHDFHSMDLQQLFRTRLRGESDSFREQFIDHWLTSSFLGYLDKPFGLNVSTIITGGDVATHRMAPHYDHEHNMFFLDDEGAIDRMRKPLAELQGGLHAKNIQFIKQNYPQQFQRFMDLITRLKNSPKLTTICDVTGLQDFWTPILRNETGPIPQSAVNEKLSKLSQEVPNKIKNRVDLFSSQK
jgi:hypothetical protein